MILQRENLSINPMWMSIFRQRMSLMCCDAKSVMHMKGVTTLTILTRQPIIVNSALQKMFKKMLLLIPRHLNFLFSCRQFKRRFLLNGSQSDDQDVQNGTELYSNLV